MAMTFKPFVLGFLLTPLMGQATARQGTPADLKQGEFTSPLVIELPLDRLRTPEPGHAYPFTDQDRFVCDGVSIPLILIRTSIGSDQVKLALKTTVFVRPSHDREVTLHYTLLGGDGTPSLATEQEISAEEKKYSSDQSTLVLSKAAFEDLFKGEGHPRLKLVMTVAADR